ncbi:hypothetical protein [Streptomyces microflavus]|uniref:Uncharacterized protein n=1 Tax=Streptomyces microflavus TaxID=1919 RepID=A0A7H8MYB6_STRMI|nr:hypothetical protein [Streptomyces microflavus]QKW47149.1 hypothetical protein HUT09_33975 [Streptomyces microflavus]
MTGSNEITIGKWTISEGADGELVFTKDGSTQARLTPGGKLIGANSGAPICYGDDVEVTSFRTGASLSATTHHGDGDTPGEWNGWAYWSSDQPKQDADVHLRIHPYGD